MFFVPYRFAIPRAGVEHAPKTACALSLAADSVRVERRGERALALRPRGGFMAEPSAALFRRADRPFCVGEKIALDGVTMELTELTRRGAPAEAVFHFDAPLEDGRYLWLAWESTKFVEMVPPKVGETVTVGVDRRRSCWRKRSEWGREDEHEHEHESFKRARARPRTPRTSRSRGR